MGNPRASWAFARRLPPVWLGTCIWKSSRSILILLGLKKGVVLGSPEAGTSLRNYVRVTGCCPHWTVIWWWVEPRSRAGCEGGGPSRGWLTQQSWGASTRGEGSGPARLRSHRPNEASLSPSTSVSQSLCLSLTLPSLQRLNYEGNTRLFFIDEHSVLT